MGSFGSLEGAYALSIVIGAAAMIGGIWLWIRDLIQLLRGRLGPARAATPRFWQLLLCLLFLGPLGLHRRLLGRSYSWLVFPLLTAAIGLCAADAIAQFTFGHHLDKEWGGISAGQATWALELGMGGALLVALAIAYLHDLVHVLKGSSDRGTSRRSTGACSTRTRARPPRRLPPPRRWAGDVEALRYPQPQRHADLSL